MSDPTEVPPLYQTCDAPGKYFIFVKIGLLGKACLNWKKKRGVCVCEERKKDLLQPAGKALAAQTLRLNSHKTELASDSLQTERVAG